MFLIPAQRVLAMRDGWPRPFSDYSPGDPFSVRAFQRAVARARREGIRRCPGTLPAGAQAKGEFRDLLQRHVFGDFHLKVDKVRQKRLVLGTDADPLPYMVWSAGQREFVPLLLGLYWLMPPAKVARRGTIEWVVIEESEMGLHPRAISVVMLMVFELMKRGYRVCLSTHSPQVLEAVWALEHLRANDASPAELLATFDAPGTQAMQNVAKAVMEKTVKVFYFDRETRATRDISDLDPGQEEAGRAGLGWTHGVQRTRQRRCSPRRGERGRGGAIVTFKKAVEDTPNLNHGWCAGLRALSRADKDHVTAEDPDRLTGSVNVDAMLKEGRPEEPRWDYAIGHLPTNSNRK